MSLRDGRNAIAYPPDRVAHNCTCRLSCHREETEGRIRLLRRCRRACATCPGIGVKPSFWLRSTSRYKSSRQRRSKNDSITFVVRAKNGTPQYMRDGGLPPRCEMRLCASCREAPTVVLRFSCQRSIWKCHWHPEGFGADSWSRSIVTARKNHMPPHIQSAKWGVRSINLSLKRLVIMHFTLNLWA